MAKVALKLHFHFIVGVLFLCQDKRKTGGNMEEYIIRLCHCGLSIGKAYEVFFQLVKTGGYHALESYIAELEADDVD